jgi:hypothetical protein
MGHARTRRCWTASRRFFKALREQVEAQLAGKAPEQAKAQIQAVRAAGKKFAALTGERQLPRHAHARSHGTFSV